MQVSSVSKMNLPLSPLQDDHEKITDSSESPSLHQIIQDQFFKSSSPTFQLSNLSHSVSDKHTQQKSRISDFFFYLFNFIRGKKPKLTKEFRENLTQFKFQFNSQKVLLSKYSKTNKTIIASIESKLKTIETKAEFLKIFNQIQRDFTSIKVNPLWTPIAEGLAKQVWSSTNPEVSHVLFTARTGAKVKEIMSEVQVAQQIRTSLYEKHIQSIFRKNLNPDLNLNDLVKKFVKEFSSTDPHLLLDLLNSYRLHQTKQEEFASLMKINLSLANEILAIFFDPKQEEVQNLFSSGQNLALNMLVLEGNKRINETYTVQSDKAIDNLTDDLKKSNEEKSLNFHQNLDYGLKFCVGLNDLHQAGYVHGDLKLENILVYNPKKSNPSNYKDIKLSDFGKTIALDSKSYAFHTGNRRYAAPEGVLGQKSEVYDAAIILINLLEEELLPISPPERQEPMLVEITAENEKKSISANKFRGIIKYLTEHQSFSTHVAGRNVAINLKLANHYLSTKI